MTRTFHTRTVVPSAALTITLTNMLTSIMLTIILTLMLTLTRAVVLSTTPAMVP